MVRSVRGDAVANAGGHARSDANDWADTVGACNHPYPGAGDRRVNAASGELDRAAGKRHTRRATGGLDAPADRR